MGKKKFKFDYCICEGGEASFVNVCSKCDKLCHTENCLMCGVKIDEGQVCDKRNPTLRGKGVLCADLHLHSHDLSDQPGGVRMLLVEQKPAMSEFLNWIKTCPKGLFDNVYLHMGPDEEVIFGHTIKKKNTFKILIDK